MASKTQIAATVKTPFAANNVYSTNLQLRRFAVEHWRDSIAVNDAGLASFRNPYYVLDLWGLASEEARHARREDDSNEWADRLARDRGVDLVIVYESWFRDTGGQLPESWEKVGDLGFQRPHTHSGGRKSLLLLAPSRRAELLRALEAFRSTLPSRTATVKRAPDRRHRRPATVRTRSKSALLQRVELPLPSKGSSR